MSSLEIGGVVGKGGLGVLVAGLIASEMFNLGVSGVLSFALIVFVGAGAVALISRSM